MIALIKYREKFLIIFLYFCWYSFVIPSFYYHYPSILIFHNVPKINTKYTNFLNVNYRAHSFEPMKLGHNLRKIRIWKSKNTQKKLNNLEKIYGALKIFVSYPKRQNFNKWNFIFYSNFQYLYLKNYSSWEFKFFFGY